MHLKLLLGALHSMTSQSNKFNESWTACTGSTCTLYMRLKISNILLRGTFTEWFSIRTK